MLSSFPEPHESLYFSQLSLFAFASPCWAMAHGLVPWAECFSLSRSHYLSSLWGTVSLYSISWTKKWRDGGRHKIWVFDAWILCSQLNSRLNNPFGQNEGCLNFEGKERKRRWTLALPVSIVAFAFLLMVTCSIVVFCCAWVSHTDLIDE